MKTAWKIFWGVGFVLLAVALILDAIGVLSSVTSPFGEVSAIALILSFFLICYAISRIIKLHIEEIFVPLSFVFMLLERNIANLCGLQSADIINNWLLFGCAILMWLGFSILFSGIRRKRKHLHTVFETEACDDDDDDDDKEGFSCNIGHASKYINCEGFKHEEIENNLGSLNVFFENVEAYEGGGIIIFDNNLGALTIHVPSAWCAQLDCDNSIGVTVLPTAQNPDGPVLKIKGDNNLGKISVKYV